jgi:hypothetical protein
MGLEKIILNVNNKEMTHGDVDLIAKHRSLLERVQLYFNREVYISYNNSEYDDNIENGSTMVNMWSAENGADMIIPELDTAFGYKYCTDGVFVPNEGYLTVGDSVPLLQYKDNSFYFLYDVCEYNSEDELLLMGKLLTDMLILIAGSEEAVNAQITENARIEQERTTKAFIKRMSDRERKNKDDRARNLREKKENMENYRREIRKMALAIQVEEDILNANVSAIDRLEETLNKELEIMKNNKKIENVTINDDGYIIVNTRTIYSNVLGKDGKTRRYRFGEYTVRIDASNGRIRFINKNDSDKRNSCWGDNCNHPHVQENGEACLGSASTLIMDCVDRYQWGILADVLVNYLESVNTGDSAGKYYWHWDEVDADGVKVTEQYIPS